MNVYIVYSYKDQLAVSNYLQKIKNEVSDFNPCMINGGNFWKRNAKALIKESNFILFFCGDSSCKSKSIRWELNISQKYGKRIYTILLADNNTLPAALYKKDKYSGIQIEYKNVINYTQIKNIIEDYKNEDYDLLNLDDEAIEEHINDLLDQYKLYVQTSETLVDRRQKANTYYLSVNSCFITVYAIFISSSINNFFKLQIGIIITLLGIFLCSSWKKAIRTYGNLNSGKFKVINAIERKLPANLFDAEWKALSDQLNNQTYVTFTKSEQDVPLIFTISYILFLGFTVISVISGKMGNINTLLSPIKDFFF